MAYIPTTFVDRSVEFPNRRKLTAVSGLADTFDVARAEGTVFAAGTKLDAANLNAEFGKIKTETDDINNSLNNMCISFAEYVGNKNQNVNIIRGNRITIGTTVIIDLTIQITAALQAWTHIFTWGQPITSSVNVTDTSGAHPFQLNPSYVQTSAYTDPGTYTILAPLY